MKPHDKQKRPAPQAVILAAGKGTRMAGDLPKVLQPVAGEPMVRWVVEACRQAAVERCILVVGYKAELVREAFEGEDDVAFVEQREQLGTGHAAKMATPLFENEPATDVFVLAGDGPLIRAATLRKLLTVHRETGAAATMATALLENPAGYGRVQRDADGKFKAIVEQADCTPQQAQIREINPSYYCFDSATLFSALSQVRNDNKKGEYYLTDVPGLLSKLGKTVTVVDAVPAEDVLSANTTEQLAEVDAILRSRIEKEAGSMAR